jgi:hypothetical protein
MKGENMKFKVGDLVRVKEGIEEDDKSSFVEWMREYEGKTFCVVGFSNFGNCYLLKGIEGWEWSEGLLEDWLPDEKPEEDIINQPSHYTQGNIEPIDFITSNQMSFCQGNVIKYVTRFKFKGGLTDLKKAKFYLNKLIKEEEENG